MRKIFAPKLTTKLTVNLVSTHNEAGHTTCWCSGSDCLDIWQGVADGQCWLLQWGIRFVYISIYIFLMFCIHIYGQYSTAI